jgi:RND family efflux transporter MFP subunit
MVVPGMPVRTGQPLVTFSVAPTARSTYLQAVAALAAAEKQRVNTAQLLSQQLATTDQLAQADKAVSDAHATLSALRAEGASQAVQTLSAPFDGVVTAISVAQGDRTQPGAALVTLARSSGIVVTVGVEPDRRSDVAIGQPAKLQRLSGGNVVAGRVVRAASALNPRTRMVDVDLSVPAGLLLPGEAMQVVIETGQIQGWIVPHRAVVTANGPSKIFQVAGNKAKSIPVRVLLSSGKDDVVDGAVNRRQPIIVDGAYQVHNGGAIRFGR